MKNRIKKSILLVLVALMFLSSAPVFAEEGAENTIHISNAKELKQFAALCSYDKYSEGKTVILDNDIDLNGVDMDPIPIFCGTFEGNGHTISGYAVNKNLSPVGLIGVLSRNASVKNLTVKAYISSGSEFVGGIVGQNYGLLVNCVFNGTVSGNGKTGGIAGKNCVSGTIESCISYGTIFAKSMAGGIAGYNSGTITACINESSVNISTLDPSFSLDAVDIDVTNGLSGIVSPESYNIVSDVGGMAGFSDGLILGSTNNGTIGYQHIGYNIGGIAGRSSGHIATCRNEGIVYGRRYVGGITGMAEPYVIMGLSASSLENIRTQMHKLSDLIDTAVNDASTGSSDISIHLSVINSYLYSANDNVNELSGQLTEYWDGTVAEIDRGMEIVDNVIHRMSEISDEMEDVVFYISSGMDSLEKTSAEFNLVAQDASNAAKYLQYANDDSSQAVRLINEASDEISSGTAIISGAIDRDTGVVDGKEVQKGIDLISDGLSILNNGDAQSGGKGAFDYLADAGADLDKAADYLSDAAYKTEKMSEYLNSAMKSFNKASTVMEDVSADISDLMRYLDNVETLQFAPVGPSTKESSDALYENVRSISEELEALNNTTDNLSKRLSDDLSAINKQFTKIMDLVIDAVEEVENASVSSVVEDTSDEDIASVVYGKIYACINDGNVNGDAQTGGIAGSMSIYNEAEPDADSAKLTTVLHRTYELKCILQNCTNNGNVTGRNNYVGAVCGYGQLGVITNCKGYGYITSENGNYVGGISGGSDNKILGSYSKASLSGSKYVGGILGCADSNDTGSSALIKNCMSLVEIRDAAQFYGAVAGYDTGTFANNIFTSDVLSGLDRISYKGKAEPVSYDELVKKDNLPSEFKSFTIKFKVDDELVKLVEFNYGDSFDSGILPDIPKKQGCYAYWSETDFENIKFDILSEAVYENYISALDSNVKRDDGRPVFIVQGDFDDGSSLKVYAVEQDNNQPTNTAEEWILNFDSKMDSTYSVRFLPAKPDEEYEVYVHNEKGDWVKTDSSKIGTYLMFDFSGSDKTVAFVRVEDHTQQILLAVIILVALLGCFVLVKAIKHRKQKN